MTTLLWIVYTLGFLGVLLSTGVEFFDEPGGIFWAALLALLWPLVALVLCLSIGVGLWNDRAHIRWPWQAKSGE